MVYVAQKLIPVQSVRIAIEQIQQIIISGHVPDRQIDGTQRAPYQK
jgi:hypothetical protein